MREFPGQVGSTKASIVGTIGNGTVKQKPDFFYPDVISAERVNANYGQGSLSNSIQSKKYKRKPL